MDAKNFNQTILSVTHRWEQAIESLPLWLQRLLLAVSVGIVFSELVASITRR